MIIQPTRIDKIRIFKGSLTKAIFIIFQEGKAEISIPLDEEQYQKFKELLEKFDQLEDKYKGTEVEL